MLKCLSMDTNEMSEDSANKTSISHQLKFGVERLLSTNNDKIDKSNEKIQVKNCDQINNYANHAHALNLQIGGYHSIATLNNVMNNANFRAGYSASDLFVRSDAFFNYFHQKNFSSRDIKPNISLFGSESNNNPSRSQNLRPLKTEFSSNPQSTSNPTSNGQQQSSNIKRKRSWSRAVFSNLQRKGLERQFEFQKYITKPDRKKLAARLGLKDAQVKVWFQNRRMKWRHSTISSSSSNNKNSSTFKIEGITSSSDEDDEIDVVSDISYELG